MVQSVAISSVPGRRASVHLPYLLPHRNSLLFRIRVPDDVRPCLGRREYRRSLGPSYTREAKARSLRLAAAAHEIFSFARAVLTARGSDQGYTKHSPEDKDFSVPEDKKQDDTVYINLQGRSLSSLTDAEIRAIADAVLLTALKASSLLSMDAAFQAYLGPGETHSDIPDAAGLEMDVILNRLEALSVTKKQDSGITATSEAHYVSDCHKEAKERYRQFLIGGESDEEISFMTDRALKAQGIITDPLTERRQAILTVPPHASIPYIKAYHEILKASIAFHDLASQTAVGDFEKHDTEIERLETRLADRTTGTPPQVAPPAPSLPNGIETPLLAVAFEEMFKGKTLDGSWKPKVAQMERKKFELFQTVVDPDSRLRVCDIRAQHLSKFKEILFLMPANKGKKEEYRDLDMASFLRLVEAGKVPGEIRMTANTIRTYCQSVTAFINWSAQREYHSNAAITGLLRIKAEKRPHEYRAPFTDSDISNIFAPGLYTNASTATPSRFWLPLIALFTGARLEELAQLHTDDIVLVNRQGDVRRVFAPEGRQELGPDETLCLYINDSKPYQRLKNAPSRRHVPLSPTLAGDLGFFEYASDVFRQGERYRANGKTIPGDGRLFPELTRKRDTDNFGHPITKWFSGLTDKAGIIQNKEEGGKVFHSFRHNVSRWCTLQGNIQEMYVSRLLGHSHDTMTFGRYGSDAAPHRLFEEVVSKYGEHLCSLLDIDGLKQSKWAAGSGDSDR